MTRIQKKKNDLSLQRKARLTAYVLVIIILITGGVALWEQYTVLKASRLTIERDSYHAMLCGQTSTAALQCRRYEKDIFLNVRDPKVRDEYYRKWDDAYIEMAEIIERFHTSADTSETRNEAHHLEDSARKYRRSFLVVWEKILAGSIRDAESANLALIPLKKDVRSIIQLSQSLAKEKIQITANSIETLRYFLIANIFVTAILVLVPSTTVLIWSWKFGQMLLKKNQELQDMQQQALAANTAKSRFLANMSHEIRTPMTAIIGYAEILRDSDVTAPQRMEHIHAIQSSADHLLTLINDILDLSKIEADKLILEKGTVHPVELVAGLLSMLRITASSKGITLTGEFPTPIPATIQTDGHRLRQVLVNLIGNAIKFTDVGGVKVVCTFLPNELHNTPAMQFDVIDTGVGMEPQVMEQLGKAFVQGQADTTRKFGGTGLGLAISKRIVEMMNGRMDISSNPGQGSTFSIVIPTGSLDGVEMQENPAEVVLNYQNRQKEEEQQPPRDIRGVRVLLAEDGKVNQRLIELILKKVGAEIVIVENGSDAVTEAMTNKYDVILMDLQMPIMDGLTATKKLRQVGYTKPIIALTASALREDCEKCTAAGCSYYLSKPVKRNVLIDTIAEFTGNDTVSV